MNAQADRYGVMGYPVSHSRSPVIHRLFAEQTGQNMQYELLQVKPEHLSRAVDQFARTGGRGLNITVPHKQAVVALCDSLGERARIADAVNTLSFDGGLISGDNTDGVGLKADLENNLGMNLAGASILILGAGGATRGIVEPLLGMRPERLHIANRTLDRAEAIVDEFSSYGPIWACGFGDVPGGKPFDLVINATSAGLRGEAPPYPGAAVAKDTLCYDLSYSLKPTPFLEWARAQGAARTVMGWGMLVEQAAESFAIWRGIRPDTAPVLARMRFNAS